MSGYKTRRNHIKEELKNPEFKKAYNREDFIIRVAVQIATERQRHNLTQKELARKLHTSQQTISRIEKGDQNITIGLIERMAEIFGKKPILKFD
ncbi:MAG: anaerobic benzoate catabolism transcriptional regulator [Elusimicrobia bacterium ADurb.Bin231]|nr:MAG: anaerobic benzoate catabolism transcriptional regulator [Elusimicrobia bacterium ADurb.Bin231]